MMQYAWNALILIVSKPGGETKESGEPADLPSTNSGEKQEEGGGEVEEEEMREKEGVLEDEEKE